MSYKFFFDPENLCPYYKTCSLRLAQDACDYTCPRYREMHYLLDRSGLPRKLYFPAPLYAEDVDKEAFKRFAGYRQHIEEFVKNGDNLYIFSQSTGTGKTTVSAKLLLSFFDRIWAGNGYTHRGLFIHVPTFLTSVKSNIGDKNEYTMFVMDTLPTVDLVVWDDIASTNLSDFDHTTLLSYVDQRVVNGRANIYNGNLGAEEMETALGKRLYSRVWEGSEVIELRGGDRRGFVPPNKSD